MTSKIEIPSWYPLPVYQRELTPEEWLHEIFKRSVIREILGDSSSTQQHQLEKFNAIILRDEIKDMRSLLQGQLNQPIRDLSIAENLYITELIKQDKSYTENPQTKVLESAIKAKAQNIPLTNEQKEAFAQFHDTPWHSFHENTHDKNWYPRIPYLIGAPVTINPYYFRTDILSALKNLLTRWTHKTLRVISPNIFSTWTEKKILAIFDLRAWHKINNIEFSKIEVARLLWPNPPISKKKKANTVYLDDYIDAAIDLCDKDIHQGNVEMLFKTCENRKFFKEKQNSLKITKKT